MPQNTTYFNVVFRDTGPLTHISVPFIILITS
jgi:hypothetical protein